MTDPKHSGKLFDLREQGYSTRDIADELGITKASVERALKTDIAQLSGAVPARAAKQTILSATNGELGILNIKLDHETQTGTGEQVQPDHQQTA